MLILYDHILIGEDQDSADLMQAFYGLSYRIPLDHQRRYSANNETKAMKGIRNSALHLHYIKGFESLKLMNSLVSLYPEQAVRPHPPRPVSTYVFYMRLENENSLTYH